MNRKTKLVVLGLVENKERKFLISRRHDPEFPDAHDMWDLPGGRNEFGERLEDTLHRELLEETGLTVEISHMFPTSECKLWNHADFTQHTVVLCYHCTYVSGELHLDDEKISELRWVSLHELHTYQFLPTTQRFIDMLIDPAT